ncbi:nitrogen regulatory protein P-II [Clostridium homopropionicum DSM 5847]|uniref:Nitrogen regulatory protein P-II n=1 Tax=Clostridium homopropionicum DSM 5847 TaxID=1121318 RepID=A0A0L6ZEK3_9CLOT|nr:P-II family nitrogen regulator [Clostridium homopropionicum]KOA21203.1 nitrogen regulatory protein P-II [Clostridium homopropionicum DSM 5847]SFG27150.1 nitrogen regulatory protein P-II family [Clostridium homopropionicum]
MKEIMAIIRMNMINKTKDALLKEGFPSFYCRKVMGRGKKKVDFSIFDTSLNVEDLASSNIVGEIVETQRLIPKRMISLVVNDEDAEKVVKTIIDINITGNPGDGKIFVMDIPETIRIRTGEVNEEAI